MIITSEADRKRFTAIRVAMGEKDFSAGQVTALCTGLAWRDNKELAATLGQRLTSSKRTLGKWLHKYQGAVVDGFRLTPEYDRKMCSWRYSFLDVTRESPEALETMDALEAEERIDGAHIRTQRIENTKLIEKAIAKEEDQKARTKCEEVNTAIRDVLADAVERGRKEAAEVTARFERPQMPPPAAAPSIEKPRLEPTVTAGGWRQPTRAELAARHQQNEGPAVSSDWAHKGPIQLRGFRFDH